MTRKYSRRAFASLLGGLGAAVTVPTATAQSSTQRGITGTIETEPSTVDFNPYRSEGTAEYVQDVVFEPIARYDASAGEFTLVGLDAWAVDGDAVTLTVREGLEWHDGEPVTATDLRAKLLLDAETGEGIGPYVQEASAIDDVTVEVTLTEPVAPQLVRHRLGSRRIDTPRSVYGEFLDGSVDDLRAFSLGRNEVVGSGPFATVDDQQSATALLTRTYDGHPDAGDLAVDAYDFVYREVLGDELAAVDHGVVDVGNLGYAPPQSLDGRDGLVEARVPSRWGYGLVPHHEHEHVGRRAVRRAIAYVLDRRAIAESTGLPGKRPTPIPTAVPMDDQDRWLGDAADDYETYGIDESRTDRATDLLLEAGYALEDGTWVDADGAPVELPITVPSGWSDWTAATQAVVEQLRAFGFEASVDGQPFSSIVDRVWSESDFVLLAASALPGREAAFPLAALDHQFLDPFRGYDHGYLGGDREAVTVPARDGVGTTTVRPAELVDRLRHAPDASRARELVRQGAWIANRDLPMLPLVEQSDQVIYDADRLDLPPAEDGDFRVQWPTTRLIRSGRLEVTAPRATAPPVVDGTVPTDPDDDGVYEDLNGNGQIDYADVVELFDSVGSDRVAQRPGPLDLNGNGEVDFADVVELFGEV